MKHTHGKNILEYVEYECFELEYWGLILGRIIKIFHVVFIKKYLSSHWLFSRVLCF